MPTCSTKKSSPSFQTNYWKNYEHDRRYNGYYRFNKDQFYDGEFFRGSLHGEGTYKWNNLAVYEGGFYSNYKEGYASLSFSDNSYFEGLFIRNQPFGPGILTHANGRQDAGFWMGRKLVRLSRAVDFVIPRLAPTSAAKIKLLQFRHLIPLDEGNCDSAIDILKKTGCLVEPVCSPYSSLICDPRSIFFEKEAFEKAYFVNLNNLSQEFMKNSTDWKKSIRYSDEDLGEKEELKSQPVEISSHCLCPKDVFVMEYKNPDGTDTCDVESYKEEGGMGILANFTKYGTIEGLDNRIDVIKNYSEILDENYNKDETEETTKDKAKMPKIVSWNRSEICTEMIKQIFRYRAFEDTINFNLAKLILGARTAFRRTGEKEKQCLQFLKMCSIGPAHVIKDFICSYEINEELMDARGNNSLMFAAATDQHEIIDVLLDFGVDVNTFNDESLTPLNLCLLRRLAQTNAICNWETAFLPKEIDKTMISESFTQTEGIEYLESISSLDRIFGDGMSITNSQSSFSCSKIFANSPPTSFKNIAESSSCRVLGETKTYPSLSQITLIKFSKSEESPNSECGIKNAKKTVSVSTFPRGDEFTQETGSTNPTPQIHVKIVPQSNKREEFEKSIQQSSTDKYLFEFSFENKPKMGGNQGKSVSIKSSKGKANKTQRENSKEEETEVGRTLDSELIKKVADIDKTIEKLLKRGANPNISEVPKPSIHLGVYTKDIKTVYALLLHGASPDCQLYSNEGLLTPLHVIVLQKSAPEYIDICDLLLKFGANPEEETVPEFSLCEEEKDFLDPEQGRTPLQLLCMRPDLEYVNSVDNLIKIGLMLAKVSDKRHFYRGHSCLTLAMRSNNLKLLKALLDSKYYDPNEILGEDRGTALHFLVSTELQKKTSYETSIKICDLLIGGGANPLKKFKSPPKLKGTCIDYGYREIEAQREKPKLSSSGKKSEKLTVKDTLKDHEKIVDYLKTIASEMAKKKATKHSNGSGKKEDQDSSKKEFISTQKTSENDEKSIKSNKIKEIGKNNAQNAAEKVKRQERAEKDVSDDLKKNTNKNSESQKDKSRKQFKEEERNDAESTKEKEGKDVKSMKEKGGKDAKSTNEKEGKDAKSMKEKEGKDAKSMKEKEGKDAKNMKEKEGKDAKSMKEKEGKDAKSMKEKEEKDVKSTKEKEKDRGAGIKRSLEETKISKKIKKEEVPTEKNKSKDDEKVIRGKRLEKESRTADSTLLKLIKSSTKTLPLKKFGTRSETFPEKLRQTLLRIYGTCANVDINEFLVPYVVLRNGDLYYRFQGKSDRKEQYSLI